MPQDASATGRYKIIIRGQAQTVEPFSQRGIDR